MKLSKLMSRAIMLVNDMPVLIESGGKRYEVITAKRMRNQMRYGPEFYFGIVLGKEVDIKKLKNED